MNPEKMLRRPSHSSFLQRHTEPDKQSCRHRCRQEALPPRARAEFASFVQYSFAPKSAVAPCFILPTSVAVEDSLASPLLYRVPQNVRHSTIYMSRIRRFRLRMPRRPHCRRGRTPFQVRSPPKSPRFCATTLISVNCFGGSMPGLSNQHAVQGALR